MNVEKIQQIMNQHRVAQNKSDEEIVEREEKLNQDIFKSLKVTPKLKNERIRDIADKYETHHSRVLRICKDNEIPHSWLGRSANTHWDDLSKFQKAILKENYRLNGYRAPISSKQGGSASAGKRRLYSQKRIADGLGVDDDRISYTLRCYWWLTLPMFFPEEENLNVNKERRESGLDKVIDDAVAANGHEPEDEEEEPMSETEESEPEEVTDFKLDCVEEEDVTSLGLEQYMKQVELPEKTYIQFTNPDHDDVDADETDEHVNIQRQRFNAAHNIKTSTNIDRTALVGDFLIAVDMEVRQEKEGSIQEFLQQLQR